jgi:hypothetical protein
MEKVGLSGDAYRDLASRHVVSYSQEKAPRS